MSIVNQIKTKTSDWFKEIKKLDKNASDKIIKGLKHMSDFVSTKTRDTIIKAKSLDIKQRVYKRLDRKTIREDLKKAANSALRINEHVVPFTNKTKTLVEGSKAGQALTKIASNRWAKRSLFVAGALTAAVLVERAASTFDPKPVIPKNYEKGYDLMNQTMTDFGSPVNLIKTASKTITPYYSTVRKSITTTTQTVIDRNFALFANKNAIKHTRY